MGKLHEILAVESDLKAAAIRATKKIVALFGMPDRFLGRIRRYRPLDDEGIKLPDERQELSTTVVAELERFALEYGQWMDAAIQKECTNVKTCADVEAAGKTVIDSLPAPALLNLEARLAEIRKVYNAIPTSDDAEKWELDNQRGCYVSVPRETMRTEKTIDKVVLYDATPEHPAQVQAFNRDIPVGTWTITLFSGALSPMEKWAYLARIDVLIRATKKARQRANNIDASNRKVASALFDFINGGQSQP